MTAVWSPKSWETYTNHYEFTYDDSSIMPDILHDLNQCAPLVAATEIDSLKKAIGLAGSGQAFILHAGDCAESFHDFSSLYVNQQIALLLKMRDIIGQSATLPVITIGRIAGQYAKPRTLAYETQDGVLLPSYHGDLINQRMFNSVSRTPNPIFLTLGYKHAQITHALIRQAITGNIQPVYTSHEALHIPYEQSLTHQVDGRWYLLSTHLPWIGVRTAFIESAHVEFLSGVANPIGLKVGPNIAPKVLVQLIHRLNPQAEPGRLLLISRMGADLIDDNLPALIQAVEACGIPVTWICDPMHGNTICTSEGIKTRHMDTILSEMQLAIKIHCDMQSIFAGAHFELTAQSVTECLGGAIDIKESDLHDVYHTLVDPRLNKEQSLEVAGYLGCFLRTKKFL